MNTILANTIEQLENRLLPSPIIPLIDGFLDFDFNENVETLPDPNLENEHAGAEKANLVDELEGVRQSSFEKMTEDRSNDEWLEDLLRGH